MKPDLMLMPLQFDRSAAFLRELENIAIYVQLSHDLPSGYTILRRIRFALR